jgi:alpha-tubulin suppressor-like RCC1 family protein
VFVVSTQGRVLAVDLAGSSVQEIGGLGIAEHVVSGGEHALAVNSEGAVFSWGSAVAGRLGIGDRVAGLLRKGHVPYTCTPERVQALWNKRIVGLSCGEMHCLALSIDSEVFAWGSASMGRLGVGSDALMLPCAEAKEPLLVRALQGRNVVQVTCSKVNSGALSSSGEIFTWGATCYGLTTDRGSSAAQLEPALLPCAPTDGHRIVSMAMGKLHALALSVGAKQATFPCHSPNRPPFLAILQAV